jgi:hypothetical protein
MLVVQRCTCAPVPAAVCARGAAAPGPAGVVAASVRACAGCAGVALRLPAYLCRRVRAHGELVMPGRGPRRWMRSSKQARRSAACTASQSV